MSRNKHNVGIDVIKIMACFAVLSLHFGGWGICRRLAVPSFMFISFYLASANVMHGEWSFLGRRLYRLAVPYVTWGAGGFIFGNCVGRGFTIGDLLLQILTGYPTAGHLYYIVLLMLFTVILFIIERYAQTISLYICISLLLVCLVLQYSGLNYALFSHIDGIVKNTPGRVAELLPPAIAGHLFQKAEGRMTTRSLYLACVVGLLLSTILMIAGIPIMPLGFAYQGFPPLLMCVSLCSLMIFVGGGGAEERKIISWIGALTPGIYFMHVIVGDCFLIFGGFQKSNLLAVVIFIVCGGIVSICSKSKYTRWIVK